MTHWILPAFLRQGFSPYLKVQKGKIYVGTAHGVDYFNRRAKRFEHLPIRNRVVKMIEDKENYIWMATRNDGLYKYNPRDGEYVDYQNDPHHKNSIVSDAFTTLALDREGYIWIVYSGSVLCAYHEDDDEFVRYPELHLPCDVISSIVSMWNFLWIATNKGLVKWNVRTQKRELFTKGDGLF